MTSRSSDIVPISEARARLTELAEDETALDQVIADKRMSSAELDKLLAD